MTSRRMRITTAVLLALGAALFTVGTQIERAGHVETAAEHATESGTAATTTPSPAPSPPAAVAVAPARTTRPARTASATRDPGLSAPEGSKEREAAEHRRRDAASAVAAPRKPSPRATATLAATASARTPASAAAGPDASAPEGTAAREAAEAKTTAGATSHSESSERLFGVNTESTPVVVAADLFALVLIGSVLLLSGRALRLTGLAVAVSGLVAVGLDLREAVHQHDLGKNGLLVLVVAVAVLHLGSSSGGALLARGDADRGGGGELDAAPGRARQISSCSVDSGST